MAAAVVGVGVAATAGGGAGEQNHQLATDFFASLDTAPFWGFKPKQ